MKKFCLTVLFLFALSTVAFASPLMDFSQGKGSIDLTWRDAKNSSSGDVFGDGKSKYNLDGAITLGLGNNWAFQYRSFNPQSGDTPMLAPQTGTDKSKITTNEFNILYKLDKNLAVFAGWANAKGEITFTDYPGFNFTTKTKNLWQVGFVGNTAIADKTTLWASAAFGSSSMTNWEVGVSYEFAPNFEFNVNYREFKADDFTGTSTNGTAMRLTTAKSKGLGFGVTYKF